MKRSLFGFTAAAFLAATSANAVLIAGTGFENESDNTGDYDFAAAQGGGAASGTIVPLTNLDDEGTVVINNSTASSDSAGDLGFTTAWKDTRSDFFSGLSDGDFIGVTDFVFLSGGGREGNFVFQHSDSDGSLITTFSAVDLTNYQGVTVSLLFGFEGPADFEGDGSDTTVSDYFDIYVDTNIGKLTIASLISDGVDNFDTTFPGSLDQYGTLSLLLPDTVTTATLVVETSSTSGGEAFGFDDIQFNGTLVPEPTSLALIGLGGLLVARRRRD